MIENKKSIAILLAVYQGSRYLDEMLNSLERQTMQDFTCYIHDDGSTDDTLAIIRRHQKQREDQYILIEATNHFGLGAKENFMFLLSQVQSRYYMFADQDDVWLPEKIAKTYQKMQQVEKIGQRNLKGQQTQEISSAMVYTDMYVTDEKLHVIADSFLSYIDRRPYALNYSQLLIDNPAAGCTMMINESLANRAGLIVDSNRIEMHDGWIILLASVFGKIGVIEEPLVYYRQHGDNEKGAVYEGMLDKMKRNLRDLITGHYSAEKKRFMDEKKNLASELMEQVDLPPKVRSVVRQFVHLEDMNKILRIHFLRKNQFNRAKHTLWFWFFA